MRCSRSSDDQFDDYDGELQHLVVHHGGTQGGHHAEGAGGAFDETACHLKCAAQVRGRPSAWCGPAEPASG